MTTDLWTLQHECASWVKKTFGVKSLYDPRNRAARFMEEATEVAQVEGVDEEQALKIVKRVYSRPPGEKEQEVAGSYFTFLVYLYSVGVTPQKAEELVREELARVIAAGPEKFRAKQREKFEAGTDLIDPV